MFERLRLRFDAARRLRAAIDEYRAMSLELRATPRGARLATEIVQLMDEGSWE